MSFIETPEAVGVPETIKPGPATRLRAHAASYPRPVWVLAASVLTIWTGRGMVLPFLVIYFSQIVGIQASVVGAVIAGAGLAGVAFVLVVAGQIDKHGGRPILLISLALISFSTFVGAWAHTTITFLLVALVLFCASQSYWPSIDTVVTSITDTDQVIPSMALIRVAMAVGIGLGGLFGGLLVTGGGLPEYRLLFITSAVLISLGALLIWKAIPGQMLATSSETGVRGAWGDVLADRTFLYGLIVLFTLVFGFTQLSMSIPPFLRGEAGVGEGAIGTLFFMNTLIIVLVQVPVAARVAKGNVGRLLAIAALIWGVAFLTMIATPTIAGAAALVFLVFTAGQLLFTPITAIVTVRLSPAHLRGRYFALLSITWGTSYSLATLTAGIALDFSRPILLWPAMSLLMVAGAIAALRLRSVVRLAPQPAVSMSPGDS